MELSGKEGSKNPHGTADAGSAGADAKPIVVQAHKIGDLGNYGIGKGSGANREVCR